MKWWHLIQGKISRFFQRRREKRFDRMASHEPKRILVRLPNWLGDAVMATPVLETLRSYYPHAHITAMCQSNIAPLFQTCPHIDHLFAYQRPKKPEKRQKVNEIIQQIRLGNYDLGILLTHSFSSAYWFFRGKVKKRLGFIKDGRGWMLNLPLPFPEKMEKQHLVHTYLFLIQKLTGEALFAKPSLSLSSQEKEEAYKKWIPQVAQWDNPILLGINPLAAYGSAKCWLPDRFRTVIQELTRKYSNLIVLCFGDNQGREAAQKICDQLGVRVINLAGKTSLRELMALIQSCHFFLTNDSGPMHMAAALGVPLLALFGSTSDVMTGPFQAVAVDDDHGQDRSDSSCAVIHKHVDCSPCYLRECPIDFRCMRSIEVQEVMSRLEKGIEQNLQRTKK